MLPAAIATATPALMAFWLALPIGVGVFVASRVEVMPSFVIDCSDVDDDVVPSVILLAEVDEVLTTLLGTLAELGIARASGTVAVVDVIVTAENDHDPANELDIPSDVSVELFSETALVPALGSVLAEAA